MTEYMETLKQEGTLSLYRLLAEEDRLIGLIRIRRNANAHFQERGWDLLPGMAEELTEMEKNLAETRSELRKNLKDLFAETV